MSFAIRTACAADVPDMHRLRCSVRENRLSDASRVTEDSYAPYIRAGTAWVAEAGGQMLGFAILDLPARSVWALFVAPEAEGIGIGQSLHRHMLAQAHDAGVDQLWLDTGPGTRAEQFYARAGWERAGRTPQGDVRLRIAPGD